MLLLFFFNALCVVLYYIDATLHVWIKYRSHPLHSDGLCSAQISGHESFTVGRILYLRGGQPVRDTRDRQLDVSKVASNQPFQTTASFMMFLESFSSYFYLFGLLIGHFKPLKLIAISRRLAHFALYIPFKLFCVALPALLPRATGCLFGNILWQGNRMLTLKCLTL